MFHNSVDNSTIAQLSAQYPAQCEESRGSDLDAASLAAGPDFAIVADEHGIRGVVRFDVESGTPVDEIPAAGWVS